MELLAVLIVVVVCVACAGYVVRLKHRFNAEMEFSRIENDRVKLEALEAAQKETEGWRKYESLQYNDRMKAAAATKAEQLFSEWRTEHEGNIRRDAAKRSTAVVSGKVAEHFIPFLESFEFDSQDARFLGSPIDLIVFDGLSGGDVRQVVFVEVKTAGSIVTQREAQIRAAIENRLVKWVEFRPDSKSAHTEPRG